MLYNGMERHGVPDSRQLALWGIPRILPLPSGVVMEVFEMWLRGCGGELDVDIDYALQRVDPALAWFREIYDRLGPISGRQLRTQLEGGQREALTAALAIIAEDVRSDGRRMIDEQIQERPSGRIPGSHEFYLLGRVVE